VLFRNFSSVTRPAGGPVPTFRREVGLILMVVLAVFSSVAAWTPTSYSHTARILAIPRIHPVLGEARPIRSDEWAVATPYYQIAVANQFGPRNELSPYKEPLKAYFALPSRDWSMVFKPDLWGFLVLDPAHAFALHYALLALAMVVGFTLLLRQLGCSPNYALALSLILFLSQFVQAWWTSNAPVLAYTAWPAVIFLWKTDWRIRAAGIFYVTACWLIGELYPPIIISSALAITALVAAFRPAGLRVGSSLMAGLAVGCGAGIAWLHFADLIPVMKATVYPGQRLFDGGGVHGLQILAHVFPFLVTARFEPLPLWQTNFCEVAVVGTFLPLAMACFCRAPSFPAWIRTNGVAMAVWLGAVAVLLAWLTCPLPGAFFPGLNLVAPGRMVWGFGLLVFLGCGVLGSRMTWTVTRGRLVCFLSMVALAAAYSKIWLAREAREAIRFDVLIIILMPVLLFLRQYRPQYLSDRGLVTAAVLLTTLLTFGRFNPIQSAIPVFEKDRSVVGTALRAYAAANPKGWAIENRHYGAVLNGAGVPAINHVLLQPQLAFFRKAYPGMDRAQFDQVFNRYAHIMPSMVWEPKVVQQDLISLPADPFAIPLTVQIADLPRPVDLAGAVETLDTIQLGDGTLGVAIAGWGRWSGVVPEQGLQVRLTDPGLGRIRRATAFRLARPDLVASAGDPAAFAAGFGLRLVIEPGVQSRPIRRGDVELVSIDPTAGHHALRP